METIGRYAFIGGLAISVGAGLLALANIAIGTMGLAALVVLGIIVGFLNVTGNEVQQFLLGTVALMLVGAALGTAFSTVPVLPAILSAFTSFVAGAALIVALKEVYTITKSK